MAFSPSEDKNDAIQDEPLDPYAKSKNARRVDRSAAAMALADLKRASRKRTGPGLRERKEIRARSVERFGGVIEEDLSGENQLILEKGVDFGQSRSGDKWYHSEANSAIVELQRALWYCDAIMRGVSEDKRDNIQAERVKAATHRLRHSIKLVQDLGVQTNTVKRAHWLLSRFMRFSEKDRKYRREKKIEKAKTILPQSWFEKTISRKEKKVQKEEERGIQIDNAFENLRLLTMKTKRSEKGLALISVESCDHNKHSTVEKILQRRQRRLKELQERASPTLRQVEALAKHSKSNRRSAKKLHRDIAHVVERPLTPEERYSESIYSDYEEYGRNLREVEKMEKETLEYNRIAEMEEAARIMEAKTNSLALKDHAQNHDPSQFKKTSTIDQVSDISGEDSKLSVFSGETSKDSASPRNRKKNLKTLMSEEEIIAMQAETDFHEDVVTFLDGSGHVKNTGPISRLKFTANMKMKYLDLRMKSLRRTKIVIAVIKKMKEMLYKILNGSYEEDELYGTAKLSVNVQIDDDKIQDGNQEIDLDKKLDDMLRVVSVQANSSPQLSGANEADLDIFKRWAGKRVVELEPLLSNNRCEQKSMKGNDEDSDMVKSASIWVCQVCMKSNEGNALFCVVCSRPPDAPPTKWGLAKHRPRKTHPRFLYTWNKKTGEAFRRWEHEERQQKLARLRLDKPLTLSESLKESFFARAKEGNILVP